LLDSATPDPGLLSVYPVPASGQITIQMNEDINGLITVQNLMGWLCMKLKRNHRKR
jgi:hypothetical protein